MREKIYTEEKQLESRYGKEGGWKVPEGYFDRVYAEVLTKLPAYPEEPVAPVMTFWQRIKPYTYLAAMFAGIWLMMQVFHNVSESSRINLDKVPDQIAMIMESPYGKDIINTESGPMSDIEIENEVFSSYSSMDEFKKAFYAAAD